LSFASSRWATHLKKCGKRALLASDVNLESNRSLEMRVPGHGLALACLVARNGLLCALYVGLTVRAWRTRAASA
jgi:hypothetical protein